MARTLLNNAQLKQLLTLDKVHARSIDIEGASPLTGTLVGADMFVVQGAGETPTMITATQMVASGLFGGSSTVTVAEEDSSATEHRITFVDAGSGGSSGEALQVDASSLTFNPISDTLTVQTASLNAISGTAGAANDTLSLVNSASISGDLTVQGNFQVNGVQTILNVTHLEVEDKLIMVASGSNTNSDADGAGIEIECIGDGNKSLTYNASSNALKSSENVDIASGKGYMIDGTTTLNASALTIGSAVMSEADLEKLDDITNGVATASKAVVLDASKGAAHLGVLGVTEISGSGLHSEGAKHLTIRAGNSGQNGSGSMIFFARGGTADSHDGYIFSASNANKGHVIFTGDASNSQKMEFEAGGSIGIIQYSRGLDITAKQDNLTLDASNGNAVLQRGFSGGKVTVTSDTVQLNTPSGTGRTIEFHNNTFKAGEIEVYTDSGNPVKMAVKTAGQEGLSLSASAGPVGISGSHGVRIEGTGVSDTDAVATDVLYFRDSDGLMKTDRIQDILALGSSAGDGMTEAADGSRSVDIVEKVFYDGVGGGNNGAVGRMSANLLTASLDVDNDGNVASGSLQVFLNGMLQHISSAAGVTPPTDSTGAFIFDCRISGSGANAHTGNDGHTDTVPVAVCLDSALDSDDVLTIRYLKK